MRTRGRWGLGCLGWWGAHRQRPAQPACPPAPTQLPAAQSTPFLRAYGPRPQIYRVGARDGPPGDGDLVDALVEMGFTREASAAALRRFRNMDLALAYLLRNADAAAAAQAQGEGAPGAGRQPADRGGAAAAAAGAEPGAAAGAAAAAAGATEGGTVQAGGGVVAHSISDDDDGGPPQPPTATAMASACACVFAWAAWDVQQMWRWCHTHACIHDVPISCVCVPCVRVCAMHGGPQWPSGIETATALLFPGCLPLGVRLLLRAPSPPLPAAHLARRCLCCRRRRQQRHRRAAWRGRGGGT